MSREIETDGYISPVTLSDVVPYSTFSVVGPELLAVIRRNDFFKLDPAKAIKDTSYFFHNNWQSHSLPDQPEGQSSILRILESIQVDIKGAQGLTTQALKQQDICFILIFLDNYIFPKARRLSQQDLDSLLNCIQLTQDQKSILTQDAKDKLEN